MKTSLLARYLALVAVLALGVAAGCIRNEPKEIVAKGDILVVVTGKLKEAHEVVYTIGEQSYSIVAQGDGMTLALAQVRVINQTSTRVTLTLDGESAILEAANGEEYWPLNPSERAVETTKAPPKDNPYSVHLWGQIQLLKGYEVTGWFFFEVPVGSEFTTLLWSDVEDIRLRYF